MVLLFFFLVWMAAVDFSEMGTTLILLVSQEVKVSSYALHLDWLFCKIRIVNVVNKSQYKKGKET